MTGKTIYTPLPLLNIKLQKSLIWSLPVSSELNCWTRFFAPGSSSKVWSQNQNWNQFVISMYHHTPLAINCQCFEFYSFITFHRLARSLKFASRDEADTDAELCSSLVIAVKSSWEFVALVIRGNSLANFDRIKFLSKSFVNICSRSIR